MITKPMLAYNGPWELDEIHYPVLVTPKLDGIRCLKINGKFVSRTLKPIPNRYVNNTLKRLDLPDNIDGELTVLGKSFNEIQSLIMSRDGEVRNLEYCIFDFVKDNLEKRYELRCEDMKYFIGYDSYSVARSLLPSQIDNKGDLEFKRKYATEPYEEGLIVRSPRGPYKLGRSTLQEQYMLKLVDHIRDEACVKGFEPLVRNTGEVEELLGSIVVSWKGHELKIGSGFTAFQRREYWRNRAFYQDAIVTFKYKPYGMKDKPRMPVFVGFRDSDDIVV